MSKPLPMSADRSKTHQARPRTRRPGYYEAIRTLRHPEVLECPTNHEGVFAFDLARAGRE
jgi:hypothetical protein